MAGKSTHNIYVNKYNPEQSFSPSFLPHPLPENPPDLRSATAHIISQVIGSNSNKKIWEIENVGTIYLNMSGQYPISDFVPSFYWGKTKGSVALLMGKKIKEESNFPTGPQQSKIYHWHGNMGGVHAHYKSINVP